MERPETVFEWLARRRNVTVEEMKAYISVRFAEGWNSLDPARRKHTADTNAQEKNRSFSGIFLRRKNGCGKRWRRSR